MTPSKRSVIAGLAWGWLAASTGCASSEAVTGGNAAGSGGVAGAGEDAGSDAGGASGSGGSSGTGGTGGSSGSGGGADAGGSSGLPEGACPSGQFVTGVASGDLSCASLDAATRDTVTEHCSVFAGWSDECDGCSDPPEKWGRVSGNACEDGGGTDNTCQQITFGNEAVETFGMNPDGDVNGDDKFYLGLTCDTVAPRSEPAQPACPAGSFVTGVDSEGAPQCTDAASTIVSWMRSSCALYFGWLDNCDGCNDTPEKWGRTGDWGCVDEQGGDGTCTSETLSMRTVNLYGLNADGNVNGDDKFYVGLYCPELTETDETSTSSCPAGRFVSAVAADGTLTCTSARQAASEYFRDDCSLYFGWADSCDGCTSDPEKWGNVTSTGCGNVVGDDSACIQRTFGNATVSLFGLNTDGNVNGDDKFYFGMKCR